MNWKTESLAVDREDAQKTAEQYKYVWIRDTLLKTGMDIEKFFPEGDDPNEMTVEQKVGLRRTLGNNHIYVIDDSDGGVKIYLQDDIIGEWKKPAYVLMQDPKQIDPKKRIYVCINISFWSYFDEEEQIEEET